jgi:uncharacterized lipoprotein YmbA
MIIHHSIHVRTLAILLSVLFVSACATTSQPVDFYTLSAVPSADGKPPVANCRDVVIGIGPVLWPRYLDRPQIVTRLSPNRVSFDEFHRWAGPLNEEFQRILTDNLSMLLQTDYVVEYPGKLGYKPRYRVQIQINQFDGQPGEAVTLKAAWSIINQPGAEAPVLHESLIRQATVGEGYEGMVAAASAAVAELSRQIAAEISTRCATPPGRRGQGER